MEDEIPNLNKVGRHLLADSEEFEPAPSALLQASFPTGPLALGARGAGGYEIEMSGGVCLRLPESFEDGEVRRLLALLKEAG